MWPGEHEDVTVWADALQAEGDPLGQLVALGLRAEQLRREDPDAATQLSFELERSIDAQLEDLLGPLARMSIVELDWQLGVVRALTLREFVGRERDELLDALADLFARPAMRFLDHVHIEAQLDVRTELAVLELLCRPAIPVRPRKVILGPMPPRFRVIRALSQLDQRRWGSKWSSTQAVEPMTALLERGVILLSRGGQPHALPWSAGHQSERLRKLDRLLSEPWTPRHATLLGAALWDTSIRVRRRLIAAIPQLPDTAAPLLSSLLAIQTDSRPVFGDLVERAVNRATSRPVWVRAVAENWQWREPWVATELASVSLQCRAEVIAALPRMRRNAARAYEAGRWDTHATITAAIDRIAAG